jgi:hypothetical protein
VQEYKKPATTAWYAPHKRSEPFWEVVEAQGQCNQQAGACQLQLITCLHRCCCILQTGIYYDLICTAAATCCNAQDIYNTSSSSSMVRMVCLCIFDLAGWFCNHDCCFAAGFAAGFAAAFAAAVGPALAAVCCALQNEVCKHV